MALLGLGLLGAGLVVVAVSKKLPFLSARYRRRLPFGEPALLSF